jgi:SAM-dependent methyltransferase
MRGERVEQKKMSLETIPCDLCGSERFEPLFRKGSARGEIFLIQRCSRCGLVQVNPQPDLDAVKPYYDASYFTRRTDRGYDNYFSDRIRNQIRRVYEMNLRDLGFFELETTLLNRSIDSGESANPVALDAGCAAGYFVEYLRERGWEASGIEISEDAARFGIETLRLPILIGDFFSETRLHPESFDLITLWASLEHMHSPSRVFERIHQLLKPGGRLILSTCRYGFLARLRGIEWRYMNVPEHLYFFSTANLSALAERSGFEIVSRISYGSGLTAKKGASPLYRGAKFVADPLVKLLNQGDMMAAHLRKM